MFFARETPNFQNFKKQKKMSRANILRVLHAKNQPPRSKTVAYRLRTDMKKLILACFRRAKRPISKISKNKNKIVSRNKVRRSIRSALFWFLSCLSISNLVITISLRCLGLTCLETEGPRELTLKP